MALTNVNKKLARLNEVKARAAVRTRRRLAEQDEAAQVRLEAAHQAELAKITSESDKGKTSSDGSSQLVADSEKVLVEESKLAGQVNDEPATTDSLSGGLNQPNSKKGSK